MKRDAISLMESAWSDSSACKWSCKGLSVVFFSFQQEEKEIALLALLLSTFNSKWVGLVLLGKGEEASFGEKLHLSESLGRCISRLLEGQQQLYLLHGLH